MKIAIDARAFGWPGLGRYTRSLLSALSRAETQNEYVVMITRADRAEFETLRREHLSERFSVATVAGEYYSWKEQTIFWRQARRIPADLFHFTHFNVPVFFDRPYVVTVHDVTRFLFPGQIQQGLFTQLVYEQVFSRAVSRARAVIAVSETTARELERLPISLASPARVVYEGVDDQFRKPVSADSRAKVNMLLGTQAPFVLYVGVWMNHKNLPRLLSAFAEARHDFPDLKLVLIGRPKPGYINMVKLVQSAGVAAHVIFPGFVPESLLPVLYTQARCLFLPSLYEGFGLPALEAAAVGTPVVTSNVAGSAEVMGESALLVNPEYVPGMVRALRNVLGNQTLRQSLSERGRERAAAFTWDFCAAKTLEVYHQARVH